VQFVHDAAGPCDEIQNYLGCPVSFGQERNAVLLPVRTMDLVVERADPHLNAALTRLLDRLPAEESPARSPLRLAIEKELAERLPKGLPSPAELARQVGLSRRTLERRLAAEGTSIRRVSADLRRDLAVEHLRDSKHTITEIAWMLGYADVSSFAHAFRRITGRSPGSYRATAQ
jgi:AraC-like DNA-binding protein